MINKVLVANRGEIACRILKSLHASGFHSVAVFSDADRNARHVGMADEAVHIGPSPASQSYLSIERILDAVRSSGADAVHPGYGFLSENADFAQACADAGITFIGPSPEAIHLMGNKRVAKARMIEAGVPCIPGYQGADQSDETLLKEVARIGFPLMVKAAAGGGGRGMRLVNETDDVAAEIHSARRESLNAFGSQELILERAVINGRHIEIQVAADKAGNTIYLGERDCSVQRRHQKVIEEAPSPFVTPQMRKAMGEAAVEAARACKYLGVGTVEFLVDREGQFFFLEMNTRLQVEHPVTELVTGTDLVDWQLKIANGDMLPLRQEEVSLDGHAIEVRIYAEDPADSFMPQTGSIALWSPSQEPGIRVDHGIQTGDDVSPHYDPMLAKLISYGDTREDARRRLFHALGETRLLGVTTNKSFLRQLISHPDFVAGQATTDLIDASVLAQATNQARLTGHSLKVAGLCLLLARAGTAYEPWLWGQTAITEKRLILETNGETRDLRIRYAEKRFAVLAEDNTEEFQVMAFGANAFEYISGGARRRVCFALAKDTLFLDDTETTYAVIDATYRPAASETATGSGQVAASTEGMIILVAAVEGAVVQKGQLLFTIEAMKMEHRHLADCDGKILRVSASEGAQVKKGQIMVEIAPDAKEEDA
ncbi:MAG: ATP-grasp domain-containing protein [Alphaproteobacteria bacterium]|nr:MAG: ATP-grasp domain-containing protein [Alphaproteobacteria bacterium]